MSSAKPEPSKTATSDFLLYERMLISWVRTSLSLISFGFTIYKFFQLEMGSSPRPGQIMGPRGFGLTLICIGLVSLLLAVIQNRKSLQALTGRRFPMSMVRLRSSFPIRIPMAMASRGTAFTSARRESRARACSSRRVAAGTLTMTR